MATYNRLDDNGLLYLLTLLEQEIAQSGEENVIEVVQKNGTALPVSNKTVNVIVPTQTSDLTNDGDGSDNNSPFATEAYVEANGGKIDTIKVNGTTQTITNKAVDITVPTATSDLTNDSGFQDATDVQDAIDAAIAGITSFDYEVVQSLPQTGEKGVIYLVSNSGSGQNTYDEYIWIDGSPGKYEKIGTTDIDLSGYVQASEMHALTNAEIDAIWQQVFGS